MEYEICVLGLGYIGLPTASIFASKGGKKVLGVDVIPQVVDTVNSGRIHIEEPGLEVLVKSVVQSGNLRAATVPQPAEVYIIAVPTPFIATVDNPRAPDLTYVESATRSIALVVKRGALVILESTSPVGTTELMKQWLYDELIRCGRLPRGEAPNSSFPLLFAHCPERILPGQMLKELVSNDRIVGGLTPEAAQRAKEYYQTFCTAEIFTTDARTAELAKLTENSFRDVNIAFANELSLICEKLSVNVWELIRLANRHPRVKILQPGPGVGGHCIAVDPWFIVSAAPAESRLIRMAREVNDAKPHHVVAQVKECAVRFKAPTIACLGLAFKADVDDLRESPAIEIVQELGRAAVGRLLVVEPYARELPPHLAQFPGVTLMSTEEAIRAADIVLLLVNHCAFAAVDRALLRDKILIDTRGFWN